MATIGIVAAALPGHLLPIGALGRALARRGHRVVAATLPDGEPLVRAAGLEFAAIGAAEYPPGAIERVTAELGRLRGRAAFRHTIELGLALTRVVLRDAPEVLRPRRPDLLVVDQALPGGNTLAERLGVPFVSVAAALPIVLDLDVPPEPDALGAGPLGLGDGCATGWRSRRCADLARPVGAAAGGAAPGLGAAARATTRATGPRRWPRSGSSRASSSSPAACRRTSTASAR